MGSRANPSWTSVSWGAPHAAPPLEPPATAWKGPAADMPGPHRRIVELYTLAEARALSEGIPAAERAPRRERLRRARRQARAAEALWADGMRAEAIRAAAESATATARTLPESLWTRPGIGADVARLARRADREAPSTDASVTAADERAFWELLALRRRVDRRLDLAFAPAAERRRRRVWRVIGTLAAVAVAVAGALTPIPELPRIRARASGQWSPRSHGPEQAIDGDPQTEWQLPNARTGWIELRPSPPRDLTGVRLLNGHNRHYADRAVREASVELYSHGELRTRVAHEWPSIDPQPAWADVDAGAPAVDRVVIRVERYHGLGGALAEIELVE